LQLFPDSVRKHLVRLALNLWPSQASIQNNPQVRAENYRVGPLREPPWADRLSIVRVPFAHLLELPVPAAGTVVCTTTSSATAE
jgi:hypothetical protein